MGDRRHSDISQALYGIHDHSKRSTEVSRINGHPLGKLPADPIEKMVLAQVHDALGAPEVVQAVWDSARRADPGLTEPDVVLPLRNLAAVWRQLFAAEQRRIVQLLIERVIVAEDTLEIIWREPGWRELVGELRVNTIGGDLLHVEDEQEAMA